MAIEIINRFNNGNGGVSILISREVGGEIHETGEFLETREAVNLALRILHGVVDLPHEIESRIRELLPPGRFVISVRRDE